MTPVCKEFSVIPADCVARVLQFAGVRVCYRPLWCRHALHTPWSTVLDTRTCAMLRHMHFIDVPLHSSDVVLLRQTRYLPALREIVMYDNNADLSVALAQSWQPTLVALQIGNHPVYANNRHTSRRTSTLRRGWSAPPRWTHAHVRVLSLSGSNICMPSLNTSVRTGALPHLRSLYLDYNGIEDDDALHLARAFQTRSRGQRGVQHIELGYNRLTRTGDLLAVIAAWETTPSYIGLGGNQIVTLRIPPIPTLRELVLECNEFSLDAAQEMAHLIYAGAFPQLRVLDMEDNNITYTEQILLKKHLEKKLTSVLLYNGLHI